MIFDIKLGKHFRRKEQIVGGGHTATESSSITFSSVVSSDSVNIDLTIVALNYIDILACDIQNTYLTSLCRKKIWTFVGPEFGKEEGIFMLFKMALYGI